MKLKQRIGEIAPRWLVRSYRNVAAAKEFWRDFRDYAASTSWDLGSVGNDDRCDEREAILSRVTIACHGLEKGGSMPSPRRPFGVGKLQDIEALVAFAERRGINADADGYVREAAEAVADFNRTGVVSDTVTPVSDWSGQPCDYSKVESFVRTRHSVRDFDEGRTVEVSLIERIMQLAGRTPSVCNRCSYHAHYFDAREDIDRLLALQNGNAGFGHTVPGLVVVTERRSAFVGARERNQRWIDGGIFAMTLVWLFHSVGLGSCFLNWSETNAQTERLRRAARIPRSEDVVVLIAVGYAKDGHRVARSSSRSLAELFSYHTSMDCA